MGDPRGPLPIEEFAASSTTSEYSRIDQITVPSGTRVDRVDGRPAAAHQANEAKIPKSQDGKLALWLSSTRLRMAIIAIALVAVLAGIIAIAKHRKQPQAVGIGTTPPVVRLPVPSPTSSTAGASAPLSTGPKAPDQDPHAVLPQPRTDASSAGVARERSSGSPGKRSSEFGGGPCDLTPSQVPGYLDMADRNRWQGRYSDAEREYSAVLACDPRNDRARSGLARARSAQAVHTSR